MEKTFYPGKIMYSAFCGAVIAVQLLRQEEDGIIYVRALYGGTWSTEYAQFGINHYHNTREEAINYALAQLGDSITKLPSVDELRDLEMSAQPARYDLSNVYE